MCLLGWFPNRLDPGALSDAYFQRNILCWPCFPTCQLTEDSGAMQATHKISSCAQLKMVVLL